MKIRMELHSASPRASWELPGCKTRMSLKSRSPLIPPRQASQEMINGSEFSMKSQEFLCCHASALVDPQHASFALFKFGRVPQTSNKIPLPWSALILNSQKQCCIKCN